MAGSSPISPSFFNSRKIQRLAQPGIAPERRVSLFKELMLSASSLRRKGNHDESHVTLDRGIDALTQNWGELGSLQQLGILKKLDAFGTIQITEQATDLNLHKDTKHPAFIMAARLSEVFSAGEEDQIDHFETAFQKIVRRETIPKVVESFVFFAPVENILIIVSNLCEASVPSSSLCYQAKVILGGACARLKEKGGDSLRVLRDLTEFSKRATIYSNLLAEAEVAWEDYSKPPQPPSPTLPESPWQEALTIASFSLPITSAGGKERAFDPKTTMHGYEKAGAAPTVLLSSETIHGNPTEGPLKKVRTEIGQGLWLVPPLEVPSQPPSPGPLKHVPTQAWGTIIDLPPRQPATVPLKGKTTQAWETFASAETQVGHRLQESVTMHQWGPSLQAPLAELVKRLDYRKLHYKRVEVDVDPKNRSKGSKVFFAIPRDPIYQQIYRRITNPATLSPEDTKNPEVARFILGIEQINRTEYEKIIRGLSDQQARDIWLALEEKEESYTNPRTGITINLAGPIQWSILCIRGINPETLKPWP